MCCLITTLFLLGPRVATIVWWFLDSARFQAAFRTTLWLVLGILLLPWTTLIYVVVWSPATGIEGLDWLWLALALVADIGTYVGGGYGNRDKLPGGSR